MREEICQLVLCHTNLVVPWTHQSNCTNTSWTRKKCLFEITHYRKISCPRRSTMYPYVWRMVFFATKISQVFLGATWCDPLFQLIYLLLNRPCPRSKKGSKTRNKNKQQQIGKDSAHLKLLLLNKPMSCTRNHMLHIQQTAKNHEKDLRTTATGFAPTDS